MARSRGFTLIEIVIVVAVAAILAVAGTVSLRSALRNASLSGGAHELVVWLKGQRAAAMAEGRDRILVVVDAEGDGSACSLLNRDACLTVHVLRPDATWTLSGFNPGAPYTAAERVDSFRFERHIRLSTSAFTPPAPYADVTPFDPELVAVRDGRKVFAVRFTATGRVAPERATSASTPVKKKAFAFVIGSDQEALSSGASLSGIVVGFPTGIVRARAFAPGAG